MGKKEKKTLSIRTKLVLSLSAIAAVLFVSGLVSIMEFSRMSDYVSRSLIEDLERTKAAENLGNVCRRYNDRILSDVGAADSLVFVNFDRNAAIQQCDSASQVLSVRGEGPLADSIQVRYRVYAETSLQLDSVIVSDFVDSRAWFFASLQPAYNALNHAIEDYRTEVNRHLMVSADEFQEGFYRGIIPGVVITGAGLLLIFLLLFYILSYYVQPLKRMLGQLEAFNKEGVKKYSVDFEGDDELVRLNDNIRDLADENNQLKRRLRSKTEE